MDLYNIKWVTHNILSIHAGTSETFIAFHPCNTLSQSSVVVYADKL